jgi:hypothetical protein
MSFNIVCLALTKNRSKTCFAIACQFFIKIRKFGIDFSFHILDFYKIIRLQAIKCFELRDYIDTGYFILFYEGSIGPGGGGDQI